MLIKNIFEVVTLTTNNTIKRGGEVECVYVSMKGGGDGKEIFDNNQGMILRFGNGWSRFGGWMSGRVVDCDGWRWC